MKKKFTLIEVLVVVAIIGILASMLLPSLGDARQKSKLAVCKNNLKQNGFGLYLYLDDNDDSLMHVEIDQGYNAFDVWMASYLGTGASSYCPNVFDLYSGPLNSFSITSLDPPAIQFADDDRYDYKGLRVYSPNNMMSDKPATDWRSQFGIMKRTTTGPHLKIGDVANDTIAIVETYYNDPNTEYLQAWGGQGYPEIRGVQMGFHQNKGANYLQIDGAVIYGSTSQWQGSNELGYKGTWTTDSAGSFGINQGNNSNAGTAWSYIND